MNIFAIESDAQGNIDWIKSAQSHDNYRVNKMIIESCQMLSTNAQIMGEVTRYRMAHRNHPSTIWARESFCNFTNLLTLAQSLRAEFCRRHKRDKHGCDDVIAHMTALSSTSSFVDKFPSLDSTTLPLCMPDEYKSSNIVLSYRKFFANKPNLRYFSGSVPSWVYDYRTTPSGLIVV
jgi:hypothetical protein